jgi:hypothetical protein
LFGPWQVAEAVLHLALALQPLQPQQEKLNMF